MTLSTTGAFLWNFKDQVKFIVSKLLQTRDFVPGLN